MQEKHSLVGGLGIGLGVGAFCVCSARVGCSGIDLLVLAVLGGESGWVWGLLGLGHVGLFDVGCLQRRLGGIGW